MDENNHLSFWRDIYQESRKRVRKQFGAKGDLWKLAVTIIFIAIALGLIFILGLTKTLGITQGFYQIIWAFLGGDILVVIALFISEPVIAFLQMYGLVPETFLRLLKIQEDLVESRISNDANLLKTHAINQLEWVGIRVFNGEDKLFEGFLRVESIPESSDFSDSLELKRHGVTGVDLASVSQQTHNDFDVAIIQSRNGKVLIPSYGGRHFLEIMPGEYHLETHLIGSFKDPPYGSIKPKIEYWRLIYNPDTSPILKITKVTDAISILQMREKKKTS